MSNLSFFFAENVEEVNNVKLTVSRRFHDMDGKPLEWEFRPFTAYEDDDLRKSYTKRVQIPGKKNQYTNDFDANGYLAAKIAAQCVFPNLKDAALQDSWSKKLGRSIMGEVNLLLGMLDDNEFQDLAAALSNAFQTETIADKKEQAKN